MSLFHRSRPALPEVRSTFSLQQLGVLFGAVERGVLGVGSVDAALRDAATWACVKVKAQGLASMPVDEVAVSGRVRVPVEPSPILISPSGSVSRRVWTFQLAESMFTDGNVFGLVAATVDARPVQIELVDPALCVDRKMVDGVPQVRIGTKVHRRFPYGDLWHIPGEFVQAGNPFGLSPVMYGAKSTGTSLAAEQFGGQFFTDGGHPSGIISPKSDPGVDGAKAIKAAFVNATRGSRDPVVLSDATYQALQIDPKDSQFLDLMNFEVLQTCRRHGVPPSMVYATVTGQNVTYANVTQADLQFLKHTLSYPIDLVEEALSGLLPDGRVAKYNRDAILRADAAARHAVHKLRLNAKTTTVNEVRALEDEPPFPDPMFDTPGIPTAPVVGES